MWPWRLLGVAAAMFVVGFTVGYPQASLGVFHTGLFLYYCFRGVVILGLGALVFCMLGEASGSIRLVCRAVAVTHALVICAILGAVIAIPTRVVRCHFRNVSVREYVLDEVAPALEEHRARTGRYPESIDDWMGDGAPRPLEPWRLVFEREGDTWTIRLSLWGGLETTEWYLQSRSDEWHFR